MLVDAFAKPNTALLLCLHCIEIFPSMFVRSTFRWRKQLRDILKMETVIMWLTINDAIWANVPCK